MTHLPIAQANVPSGLVDFGVGQPGFDLLPLALIRRAATHALGGEDPSFLNYGFEQGHTPLRHALSQLLGPRYGVEVDPEQLFITSGASQALDLICTLFTRPGDVIYAEEPSYFLALRIFEDHGLQVRGVPIDGDGIDLDALADMLRDERPAFLYTIPTFQNPTGATLTQPRRRQLVKLAQVNDFLIVADEVYHLLHYTAAPPPPLAQYTDTGHVLSVGSFSKILAPGLRLGWIQASPDLVQRFVTCGLVDSGGGLNPFTSAVVHSMLTEGWQEEHLARLRSVYGRRVEVLDAALREQIGDRISYRRPDGGFFFWLRLPPSIDAAQLLPSALRHGVGFQPGAKFSSSRGLNDYCRLSFAFFGEDQLADGAARLARLLSV